MAVIQRRDFVRTLGSVVLGGIFVPKFERWFRVGQLYVPEPPELLITQTDLERVLKNMYQAFRINAFPKIQPLMGNRHRIYRGEDRYFDVMVRP